MKKFLLLAALSCLLPQAFAAEQILNSSISAFSGNANHVFESLMPAALKTLVSIASLQVLFSLFKDMRAGETEVKSALAGLVTTVTWMGASIWLINNKTLFISFFNEYQALAAGIASLPVADFTPSGVMDLCWQTTAAINQATTQAFKDSPLDFIVAGGPILLLLVVADVIVIICFFILALSLFIAQVEFFMMLAVAPLQFALLAMESLRNQGLAPLKGFMSIGIRIMILGLIVAATKAVANDLITNLAAGKVITASTSDLITTFFSAVSGLIACAAMTFSAGKLASSIVSGSASFSGTEALGAGARIGSLAAAGAGAAVAVGSGALGTAKKIGEAAAKIGDVKLGAAPQQMAGGNKSGASGMSSMFGGGSSNSSGLASMFGGNGSSSVSRPVPSGDMPTSKPSLAELHGDGEAAARYSAMTSPTIEDGSAAGTGTAGEASAGVRVNASGLSDQPASAASSSLSAPQQMAKDAGGDAASRSVDGGKSAGTTPVSASLAKESARSGAAGSGGFAGPSQFVPQGTGKTETGGSAGVASSSASPASLFAAQSAPIGVGGTGDAGVGSAGQSGPVQMAKEGAGVTAASAPGVANSTQQVAGADTPRAGASSGASSVPGSGPNATAGGLGSSDAIPSPSANGGGQSTPQQMDKGDGGASASDSTNQASAHTQTGAGKAPGATQSDSSTAAGSGLKDVPFSHSEREPAQFGYRKSNAERFSDSLERGINSLAGQDSATAVQVDVK